MPVHQHSQYGRAFVVQRHNALVLVRHIHALPPRIGRCQRHIAAEGGDTHFSGDIRVVFLNPLQNGITELHDGTFFAEITLRRGDEVLRLSSRPSDAIALAVRMTHEVPILAADAVLDEAGVVYEADADDEPDEALAAPDIEEFREFLDQVRPEDFAD